MKIWGTLKYSHFQCFHWKTLKMWVLYRVINQQNASQSNVFVMLPSSGCHTTIQTIAQNVKLKPLDITVDILSTPRSHKMSNYVTFINRYNLVCLYLLLAVYSWNTPYHLSTDVYCSGDSFRLVFIVPLRSSRCRFGGWGGCMDVCLLRLFLWCELEVCALGWSLAQRSPIECDVSECNRETSIMRTWPTAVCYNMGKKGPLLTNIKVHPWGVKFTQFHCKSHVM